ncbi:MAG: hypothetical protein ACREUE_14265 [Panacagrimonas sp.]
MHIRRPDEDFDKARRELLVKAMSLGLFAGGMGWNLPALAQLFGRVPRKLPQGKSIFELRGKVLVNGVAATRDTLIGPTDKIQTAAGAMLVAAVGGTAFIMREHSSMELDGKDVLVRGMRLLSGKLLTVFGKRNRDEYATMRTAVATIGIRGTGVYAEADPEKTYLCTCYGTTQIASEKDPTQTESITAMHHDAPRYVLAEPDSGKRIIPAPFLNHTDLELMTIEAIVGREVPFGLTGSEYEGPTRDY